MAGLLSHQLQAEVAKYPERLMELEQRIDRIPPIQEFKANPNSENLKAELQRYAAIMQAYTVSYKPILDKYEQYRQELVLLIDQLRGLSRETSDDKRRESLLLSVQVAEQCLSTVKMRLSVLQDQTRIYEQSFTAAKTMSEQQRLAVKQQP